MFHVCAANPRQLKGYFLTTLFLAILLFALCLILFGSTYQVNERASRMNVFCVDLDGSSIGTGLIATCQASNALFDERRPIFDFSVFETLLDVSRAVDMGDAWGAVVADDNATFSLSQAASSILNGDDATFNDYHASKALYMIYDEGRNPNSIDRFIVGFLRTLLSQFEQHYSTFFWREQFQTLFGNVSGRSLVNYTSLLVTPIATTTVNLHPISTLGGFAMTTGYIQLLSFSYIAILLSKRWVDQLMTTLNPTEQWLLLMAVGHFSTLIISLSFSSTVVIYSAVSGVNFLVFWSFCWLQMLVYLYSLLIAYYLFGEALGLLFTVYLLLNMTAGLTNLTAEAEFYGWGYATPFWHAMMAGRHIIFGSYNRIYMNISCLAAMYFASAYICLPIATGLNHHLSQVLQGTSTKHKPDPERDPL